MKLFLVLKLLIIVDVSELDFFLLARFSCLRDFLDLLWFDHFFLNFRLWCIKVVHFIILHGYISIKLFDRLVI